MQQFATVHTKSNPMPAIDIHRQHTQGMQSARAAVDHIAEAIAQQYGVGHHWKGDELHFDRHGVKGRIAVAADQVRIRVELGLLMGALKPVIEREIERQLDKYIA